MIANAVVPAYESLIDALLELRGSGKTKRESVIFRMEKNIIVMS